MSLGKLRRRTEEVAVLVDGEERRFTLSARSIADQLELMSLQSIGKAHAMAYLEEHLSLPDPVLLVRAGHAVWLSQAAAVVKILSEPADGGEALTEEEFWRLDTGDPDRVIAAQEALTNMETVLGNGSALLEAVKALASRRAGSQSAPPSPRQD